MDLPLELRLKICEWAMVTDIRVIHVFEEAGKVRPGISPTGIMPVGGFHQAFSSSTRHNTELPKSYNQLQYSCKELYKVCRGLEFKFNELRSNAWTFDTLHRQSRTHPSQAPWYNNIRDVALLGNFAIGYCADENLLHGILEFGRAHPKANIRVHVPDWKLDKQLQAFVTLGYRIQEAIRGRAAPRWITAHKGMLKQWRRGKHLNILNVSNARFYPATTWDAHTDRPYFMKILGAKQKCSEELIKEHGSIRKALDFIEQWACEGI